MHSNAVMFKQTQSLINDMPRALSSREHYIKQYNKIYKHQKFQK